MAVEIFGQSFLIAGSRSEKGELMIVATNHHPKNAIQFIFEDGNLNVFSRH